MSDIEKYKNWIWEKWGDQSGYGKCAERTLEMQAAFPELTRVRGQYFCHTWGLRDHWWLKTAEGAVVDPTARQFPSGGSCPYLEWDESQPEPTGLCLNCREHVFGFETFCSEECEIETRADMGI